MGSYFSAHLFPSCSLCSVGVTSICQHLLIKNVQTFCCQNNNAQLSPENACLNKYVFECLQNSVWESVSQSNCVEDFHSRAVVVINARSASSVWVYNFAHTGATLVVVIKDI